jgi:hypothetical protein
MVQKQMQLHPNHAMRRRMTWLPTNSDWKSCKKWRRRKMSRCKRLSQVWNQAGLGRRKGCIRRCGSEGGLISPVWMSALLTKNLAWNASWNLALISPMRRPSCKEWEKERGSEQLRQQSFAQKWLVREQSAFGVWQSVGAVRSHLRPNARRRPPFCNLHETA